jgi:hypothetical protein
MPAPIVIAFRSCFTAPGPSDTMTGRFIGKGASMQKNKFLPFFLIFIAFSFFGCPDTKIPVTTIEWEEDRDGFLQFSSNDSAYYDYAFWDVFDTEEAVMSTVTVQAKKMSGSIDTGFGMLFCYQDADNYYKVIITANGAYRVSKISGGTYVTLLDWAESTNIETGYGELNTISVTQSAAGVFDVYVNNLGTPMNTFADADFTGGEAGFYAAISNADNEHFPDEAVDIRFRMTAPIDVP